MTKCLPGFVVFVYLWKLKYFLTFLFFTSHAFDILVLAMNATTLQVSYNFIELIHNGSADTETYKIILNKAYQKMNQMGSEKFSMQKNNRLWKSIFLTVLVSQFFVGYTFLVIK